jgi:hypothetical protein
VATRRFAFASDVPPSYVEFVSEMLADTPLEVVADFYPAFAELDEYTAFEVLSRIPTAVIGGEDDLFTPAPPSRTPTGSWSCCPTPTQCGCPTAGTCR